MQCANAGWEGDTTLQRRCEDSKDSLREIDGVGTEACRYDAVYTFTTSTKHRISFNMQLTVFARVSRFLSKNT